MNPIELPKPIKFEWDEGNINKNKIKHKVDYTGAEQVFLNDELYLYPDEKHSNDKETRYIAFGHSGNGRKLIVCFTIRYNYIRIISARDMSKNERSLYEGFKRDSRLQK
jgi:uncharacterized DUF497 family protein